MTVAPVPIERRVHRRFSVFSNAIAILNQGSIHPGRIIEISLSGLVFQYRCNGDLKLEASELDILVPGFAEGIFPQKLPIKMVSDLAIAEKDPMKQTSLRRCAVAIGPLTTRQRAKLEQFIRSHAR